MGFKLAKDVLHVDKEFNIVSLHHAEQLDCLFPEEVELFDKLLLVNREIKRFENGEQFVDVIERTTLPIFE